MTTNDLGFIHRFLPASSFAKTDGKKKSNLTFLLLHGTGGNEDDLIFLGKEIEPNASILIPRGKVLENGMPRFFKRLAEGVFDLEDLKFRTNELADFIKNSSSVYGFDLKNTIAIGFSNGANIAANTLLLRSEVLKGAILFRVMIPLVPNTLPNLSDKKILLSSGLNDPIVSKGETENLYNLFSKTDANVTLKWQHSSHNLIKEDILDAREWMIINFNQ
jgi:phospholipase/carboxylesterase